MTTETIALTAPPSAGHGEPGQQGKPVHRQRNRRVQHDGEQAEATIAKDSSSLQARASPWRRHDVP